MAKYYGAIGYAVSERVRPGVIQEVIKERIYFGDVIRNTRRLEASENLNDNIALSNQISIVADAYAYENFCAIRYARWMASKWKVTSVEVQRPRLILTLGGVSNEPDPTAPEPPSDSGEDPGVE